MKHRILFFLLSLFQCLTAQTTEPLVFDKHYGDVINRWVAFPSLKNQGSIIAGYVYLDAKEGVFVQYQLSFHFGPQNELIADGIDKNELFRLRLGRAYNFKLAALSSEHCALLKIPSRPDGAAYYQFTTEQQEYLSGKYLNDDREFERAQVFLERLYSQQPHYPNLELQLAYCYNGQRRYDLTITLLPKAMENNPNEPLFYKELAFAFLNSGMTSMAEKSYQQCLEKTTDKSLKSEIGSSMAYFFYLQKKEDKFKEWSKVVTDNAEQGSQYLILLQQLENQWNNRPERELKKL
ncbi:tetratricopeptide repeat protein [Flavobacterium stagni]|uniref:Tetratricopeptide repeat protein n=1 Tax=Flavobacterium stagni TaxID=2506421 RepID=A0A4Q1K921_9FLAO|nr:tetratricopeptide repeat protein [Flavobacterium stagni]RXR22828.1 tetratricopeptide repeat protein [Flavobacterium stagni]